MLFKLEFQVGSRRRGFPGHQVCHRHHNRVFCSETSDENIFLIYLDRRYDLESSFLKKIVYLIICGTVLIEIELSELLRGIA
jgi:hypothetical protein